jgi:hypothetical protein
VEVMGDGRKFGREDHRQRPDGRHRVVVSDLLNQMPAQVRVLPTVKEKAKHPYAAGLDAGDWRGESTTSILGPSVLWRGLFSNLDIEYDEAPRILPTSSALLPFMLERLSILLKYRRLMI